MVGCCVNAALDQYLVEWLRVGMSVLGRNVRGVGMGVMEMGQDRTFYVQCVLQNDISMKTVMHGAYSDLLQSWESNGRPFPWID